MDLDEARGDILRRLNRRLNIATESLYGDVTATCVLARLESCADDRCRLSYAVAWHPPPLLVTGKGEVRDLGGAGVPLLGIAHEEPPRQRLCARGTAGRRQATGAERGCRAAGQPTQ